MLMLIAVLCAVVGSLPLLMKRAVAGVVQAVISFFIIWFFLYVATPSIAWPLFGLPGFLVLVCWMVAMMVRLGLLGDDPDLISVRFPVVGAVLYFITFVVGSGIFRADDYKNMIGQLQERVWTQDIQPKDPKHMRMATRPNAIYLAKKVLGEAGAIGSQFEISQRHMTLQMINEELWYVTPLDYTTFSSWTSTNGAPGYIMVHGEDPHRQPLIKMLPENGKMIYTPEAFFGNNLERHIRNKGFIGVALADCNFEIDDAGKPFWVVTAYRPTIMWSGEKIEGVIVVDPTNGETIFYAVGNIPSWIDRAVPKSFVERYLDWNGEYAGGWLNSWWGQKGLTEAEDPILVYGSDGQPEWVTGITSKSSSDDSLIGIVYTNSRTGKSVYYRVSGGATDGAVLGAVNKNSQVQFKHLEGADPQIYNVYGTIASVVPLLNQNNAYQGVAIVAINDIQKVAVGNDQYEALREYERMLTKGGQQVAFDKERDLQMIVGIVDRYNQEISGSGTNYYIHIVGMPHIFTGGASELSPKLPITKIGDRVKIEYYASERDVVPMHGFDNLSLVLVESKDQVEIKQRNKARVVEQEDSQDAATVIESIKQMPPEKIKSLGKQLREKK